MDHEKDSEKVPPYCQVLRFKDANGQVKEMLFPKALDLDRPKRPRTTFSESQLASLESEFQRNPYLIGKERTRLADCLGLSETQVKVWFQNRRTKSKRIKPTADEPSLSISPGGNKMRDDDHKVTQIKATHFSNGPEPNSNAVLPLHSIKLDGHSLVANTSSNQSSILPYMVTPLQQPPGPFDLHMPLYSSPNRSMSGLFPVGNNQTSLPAVAHTPVGASGHNAVHWSAPALWLPWSNQSVAYRQPMPPMK